MSKKVRGVGGLFFKSQDQKNLENVIANILASKRLITGVYLNLD